MWHFYRSLCINMDTKMQQIKRLLLFVSRMDRWKRVLVMGQEEAKLRASNTYNLVTTITHMLFDTPTWTQLQHRAMLFSWPHPPASWSPLGRSWAAMEGGSHTCSYQPFKRKKNTKMHINLQTNKTRKFWSSWANFCGLVGFVTIKEELIYFKPIKMSHPK